MGLDLDGERLASLPPFDALKALSSDGTNMSRNVTNFPSVPAIQIETIPVTNTPPAKKVQPVVPPIEPQERGSHAVRNVLEAQIALARIGISAGCIDGAMGENVRRALLAYQIHNNLPVSGELDEETKAALIVEEPLFIHYVVNAEDLGRIMKVPATWLGKSEADRLDYESVLEMVAERGRA